MKKNWQNYIKMVVMGFLIAGLAACGSASSSTSSTTTTTTTTTDYSGDTSISGSVTAESTDSTLVSDTDATSSFTINGTLTAAQVKARAEAVAAVPSIMTSEDGVAVDGATGYLYAVEDDGCTLDWTGVTVNVEDGSYALSDLADDQVYILFIVKTGYDSNGNETRLIQRNLIVVDADSGDIEDSHITARTGFYLDFMCEIVEEAGYSGLTDQQDEDLQEVFYTAFDAAVESGDITGISNVDYNVDQDMTALTEIDTSDSESVLENFQYDVTIRTWSDYLLNVLRMEEVRDIIAEQGEVPTTHEDYDSLHAQIIHVADEVMKAAIGGVDVEVDNDSNNTSETGHSVPRFFLENFAQAYLAGDEVSVEDASSCLNNAIWEDLENFKTYAFSTANIQERYLEALNDETENAVSIYNLYDMYDNVSPNVIAANMEPGVLSAFPKDASFRVNLPGDEEDTFDVVQSLLLFGMSGFFSMEDEDSMLTMVQEMAGDIDSSIMSAISTEMATMDDMYFEPITLIDCLGFIEIDSDTFYFTDSYISPVSTWVQTGTETDGENTWEVWEETMAVLAEVELYQQSGTSEVDSVMLYYPTLVNGSTVTASAEFELSDRYGEDDGDDAQTESLSVAMRATSAKSLKSFNRDAISTQSDNEPFNEFYEISPWNYDMNGDQVSPNIVDDFEDGEAVVKALDANGNVLASMTTDLVNPDLGTISWVYPEGPDMTQNNGWDDPNFEETQLPVDEDTGEATVAFEWTNVDEDDIPTGYELGYRLMVVLELNKINWDEDYGTTPNIEWDWENADHGWAGKMVYDPYDNNTIIENNTFDLADVDTTLAETAYDVSNNYQTYYRAEVRPILKRNGEGHIAWEGNSFWTRFQVGETDPWVVTLNGTITISDDVLNSIPVDENGALEGDWKIGLFESWNDGDVFWDQNDTTARAPVVNGDDEPIMADITFDSNNQATYELPAINQDDDVLTKYAYYQVMIWFDQDEKSEWGNWAQLTSATEDAIDFYDHPVEMMFSWESGIGLWQHASGIQGEYYDKDNDEWIRKELMVEDNQEIDLDIAFNHHEEFEDEE